MKVCLFLQRRFAPIGHAMAAILKEKYGVEEFCGYVSMRSNLNFLKSRKRITYTKLILDEDIYKKYRNEKIDPDYLNHLEREYGIPNLWPFVDTDRIIRNGLFLREYPYNQSPYSHDDMLKLIQVYAKTAIKFLEEEKPGVIIFPVIEGLNTMPLYHIAKKKNIKTFLIQSGRIGNKHTITEQYGDLSYVRKTFESLDNNTLINSEYRKSAEKFLADFRDKPSAHNLYDTPKWQQTSRKQQFSFLLPSYITRSIHWTIKLFIDYIRNPNRDDYTIIKPWHHILDRIKRKIRVLIGFGDLYDEIDDSENFAFYPLQKEPEMAISLFAHFYKNQLWVIEQIARSLPIQYKLYVKDHPTMSGCRTRKLYRELKKIPNVKIINPSVSSFRLIQNAKLITTLTSTAGWEGILLKKPVITFGNVFYNSLSMAKKCRAIEDLPVMIKEQLENSQYNEKELINLITAIYAESASINLTRLWDIEGGGRAEEKEAEIIPFIDLIAKKLDLKTI